MKKTLTLMFSVALMASVVLSGCSLNKDPMTTYQNAVTKTQSIKTAEDVVSFDMQSTANGKTDSAKIVADMMTNHTDKKSSGKMTLTSGKDETKVDMYTSGDFAYIKVPGEEKYLKSSTKESQLSDQTAKEYADKILQEFKDKADITKNVTMVSNKDKSKTITFNVPADKTKDLVKKIIVDTLTNEDVKKAAVDQAVAQMKAQYKGKEISEDQIKKVIDDQMTQMTKTIDTEFADLTFDNLKYVVDVNKDGFITKQVFNIGVTTKGGEKLTIALTNEIKSINGDVKVDLPTFTNDNTTDSGNFNQMFVNMFAQ